MRPRPRNLRRSKSRCPKLRPLPRRPLRHRRQPCRPHRRPSPRDDSSRPRFVCASKSPAERRSLRGRSRRRSGRRCRSRASCSHRRRSHRGQQQSQARPARGPEQVHLDREHPANCASHTRRRVRPRPACSVVLVRCHRSPCARSSPSKRGRECRRRQDVRPSASSGRRSASGRRWVSRGPRRPGASVLRRRALHPRRRRHRRSPARSRLPKA